MMDGAEPFFVQHNSYEHESRKAPPAQAPEYDIAFVLYQNERIKWPLEAKVLRTQQGISEYVRCQWPPACVPPMVGSCVPLFLFELLLKNYVMWF
ncbi:MAG: hypothetical protein E4G89_01940 [Methanothrix sp.]|nr:MAG: hypothetical protein E4G89_01940 [Methanothrix sp.]